MKPEIETPEVKANLVDVVFYIGESRNKVQIKLSSLQQFALDANLNYWEFPTADCDIECGYFPIKEFVNENLEMVVLEYVKENLV